MRTTKPISTISFNTPHYLKLKLDELQNSGKISFWAFIPHHPEDDEGDKKEHCHVFIEPSKMIQTDDIKEALKEYDPQHPTQPKGCIAFRPTKFDDWYLYGIHDRQYLLSKNQTRKYQYLHEDIVTSDQADLTFRAKSIDRLALTPMAPLIDAIEHGFTFNEYLMRASVPMQLILQTRIAWEALEQVVPYRNGRTSHSPKVFDEETGEVID